MSLTSRRSWPLYAAVALPGALFAYLQLYSQWASYDDEGYLLESLRQFVAGHTLYTDVFTQYGPLYYEVFGGFFALTGIEPTNDNGRAIVLVVWVVAATALGLLAQRATGKAWIGVTTQATALALTFLANEPMHPVGLVTLLTVALLAALPWGDRPSMRTSALLLGALCAALALVKLNQGVLAAVALVAAALFVLPAEPGRRSRARAAGAGLVLLAPLLFGPNLTADLTLRLAIFESALLAAVAVRLWAPAYERSDVKPRRWLGWLLAGAAATAAVSLALMAVLGTPPSELFDGAFIAATRHPRTSTLRLDLGWLAVFAALAAPASAVVLRTKRPPRDARVAGRLVGAAAIVFAAVSLQRTNVDGATWQYAVFAATAWLAARAPAESEATAAAALARASAVLIAATGLLQVYPVAGTQRMAAALPFLLVAALLAGDAVVIARAGERRASRPAIAAIAALFALGCWAAFGISHPVQRFTGGYADKQPIALHGAERLRVPAADARAYRTIVAATRGCDPLVTYPGMNSFNTWARKPTPTGLNTTSWMTLLRAKEQQKVVDAIDSSPRLCVLRNKTVEDLWLTYTKLSDAEVARRPLVRYLNDTPLVDTPLPADAGRAGYRLRVRSGGPLDNAER